MSDRWSVQNAKAKLSELMARARAGEPQHVGLDDACVLVSEADWNARQGASLGAWLVKSAPRGAPVPAASRASKRGDPFASKPNRKVKKR
ncbi:MAG: hypothetical protein HOP13_15585 [Alphaproteobacteria bacterium]|nr:hypothetical protein [Alphaproteobacteria bacterium]